MVEIIKFILELMKKKGVLIWVNGMRYRFKEDNEMEEIEGGEDENE
jgi:hypothetical protein